MTLVVFAEPWFDFSRVPIPFKIYNTFFLGLSRSTCVKIRVPTWNVAGLVFTGKTLNWFINHLRHFNQDKVFCKLRSWNPKIDLQCDWSGRALFYRSPCFVQHPLLIRILISFVQPQTGENVCWFTGQHKASKNLGTCGNLLLMICDRALLVKIYLPGICWHQFAPLEIVLDICILLLVV